MTEKQMVDMVERLYPVLNGDNPENAVFLIDMQDSDSFHQRKDPDYCSKFPYVWEKVSDQGLIYITR